MIAPRSKRFFKTGSPSSDGQMFFRPWHCNLQLALTEKRLGREATRVPRPAPTPLVTSSPRRFCDRRSRKWTPAWRKIIWATQVFSFSFRSPSDQRLSSILTRVRISAHLAPPVSESICSDDTHRAARACATRPAKLLKTLPRIRQGCGCPAGTPPHRLVTGEGAPCRHAVR